MPFAAVFCSAGSRFWGGNFSEAGNHVFTCLQPAPRAKGPWFWRGVQDAPAFADVFWSREAALKAPAASASGVKSWHLLLGREGGEWLEVQQPGRVERGTVGQEEGEQQESVELSKKSRCYLGNDAEPLPGRSQAGTPCERPLGSVGR